MINKVMNTTAMMAVGIITVTIACTDAGAGSDADDDMANQINIVYM
jgi:hypothetical protein